MSPPRSAPNLVQRTEEIREGKIVSLFRNGLTIQTDPPNYDNPLRVLPLGPPQDSIMNYIARCPEFVRGRRIFEPFAGAGAFGFMSLWCGAEHVDFLDINPRALEFQHANASLNHFQQDRFRSLEGDFSSYHPQDKYDVVLANPPFVPTPDGLQGTLTSNGGPEGNRFVAILLDGLPELLKPDGELLFYVFQLVRNGQPLLVDLLPKAVKGRVAEITPAQDRLLPLSTYKELYLQTHPDEERTIDNWISRLRKAHGPDLAVSHYIVHVRPGEAAGHPWVVRNNFAEKFGADFLMSADDSDSIPVDGRRR